MDQIAINAFNGEIKKRILEALKLDAREIIDLGGFESHVFSVGAKILRVTHHSHREAEQIAAELEFIRYLSESGAAVCLPNTLPNGKLLQHFDDFTVCLFDRARGNLLSEEDWTPAVIRKWGRCIGIFHRLAQTFEPQFQRIDWQVDENHDFAARIPPEQTQIVEISSELMSELKRLPVNRDIYGLIHGDAHAGNFFKQGETLTFFDFDDAIYMWFVYDIATILFGAVLAQHVNSHRLAQETMARYFLPLFMEGYGEEFSVDPFVYGELARFLKLRELSLYAVIHAHMDVDRLAGWYPQKFMKGRQRRIENEEPFLNLDFEHL